MWLTPEGGGAQADFERKARSGIEGSGQWLILRHFRLIRGQIPDPSGGWVTLTSIVHVDVTHPERWRPDLVAVEPTRANYSLVLA